MNEILLTGRLTRDPKVTYSANSKIIYMFNLAVQRFQQFEGKPTADFFDCVAFGIQGEKLNKCDIKKGTKVFVRGEARIEDYTDRNGEKKRKTEIVVTYFELLESREKSREVAANAGYTNVSHEEQDDDEVPFV